MMSEAEFLAGITGSADDFGRVTATLRSSGQPFCLIGGLAVNRYAEPVVTLDADFAIAGAAGVSEALRRDGFEVEEFAHSINARLPGSRLRIQITINSRYSHFPGRATEYELFGARLPVAALEDLVQGKLWALGDTSRRASKRVKDRADLVRLAENRPEVISMIPPNTVPEIDQMRGAR